MRKPSRGEIGVLVGALGVGAVGGAEVKKGMDKTEEVKRHNISLDIFEKLHFMNELRKGTMTEFEIPTSPLPTEKEMANNPCLSDLRDRMITEQPLPVAGKVPGFDSVVFQHNSQKRLEENGTSIALEFQTIIDTESRWINAPLAPKILTLLEEISRDQRYMIKNTNNDLEAQILVDSIARIRLNYKNRWDRGAIDKL